MCLNDFLVGYLSSEAKSFLIIPDISQKLLKILAKFQRLNPKNGVAYNKKVCIANRNAYWYNVIWLNVFATIFDHFCFTQIDKKLRSKLGSMHQLGRFSLQKKPQILDIYIFFEPLKDLIVLEWDFMNTSYILKGIFNVFFSKMAFKSLTFDHFRRFSYLLIWFVPKFGRTGSLGKPKMGHVIDITSVYKLRAAIVEILIFRLILADFWSKMAKMAEIWPKNRPKMVKNGQNLKNHQILISKSDSASTNESRSMS